MDRSTVVFGSFWFLGLLFAGTCAVRGEDALDAQLDELDRLRRGPETPFAEIENRAEQLLQEHSLAEDQGRVYYQLAHTYAQGGISVKERAQRVVEYAQKGLECPLDPIRRLRLYNYWGDGLRFADPTKPFPELRKTAATVYLKGLKEAQNYEIPTERPEQPFLILPEAGPGGLAPTAEDRRRTQERNLAAQEQWLHDRDMFQRHRVLVNQIVDIYRRKPRAATELRELASEILEDPDAVAAVMKALEAKGGLRDEEREVVPEPEPLQPRPLGWGFLLGIVPLIGFAGIAIVYALVRKRRRAA